MNRNDLAVPATFSNYGGFGGERAVMTHPRSPKKSSMSPSPSTRKKKSVSAMFGSSGGGGGGGGGGGSSMPSSSSTTLPKAAPLLEGESVHVALPSFHRRAGAAGGWKCAGCSHENHSALSNECSVCGMTRSASFHSSQMISESSNCSEDSFQYDGNGSENSLSLHNSFSAVDPNLGDELIHTNYAFGHGSLPVGLNSSLSSLQPSVTPQARFHSSFSIEQSGYQRSPTRRTNRFIGTRNRLRGLDEDSDNHSSVRSFSDWNGNEKIQSWQCPTCTFVNENSLNLACTMCGYMRSSNNNDPQPTAVSTISVPGATAAAIGGSSSSTRNSNTDKNNNPSASSAQEEAILEELRKEQLRELVSLQREIMASIENEGGGRNVAEGSAFSTETLDHEINQIQAELLPSNHTATQNSLGLEHLEGTDEGERTDDEDDARLQELLANQMEIMREFQEGRERTSPRMDKKPPATSVTAQVAVAALPRATTTTTTTNQFHHDPLFGGSTCNTAPQYNTAISLKESMQAAGGKLRIEDICVPLLWGENLSSTKQAAGQKIQS